VDKKFRLPKDEFIDGQDVEGHGRPTEPPAGDDLTILPAPPSLGLNRTPGHGGELTQPEDSDRT
jgi:hypothetical protein